jgi:hypothetical protein
MSVDENGEHARGLVLSDVTDASHVCGKIEDLAHSCDGLPAVLDMAQVELTIFGVAGDLMPFL